MTTPDRKALPDGSFPGPNAPRRTWLLILAAFVVGLLIMAGVGAVLVSIQGHKAEQTQYPLRVVQIAPTELDPAVWGKNFPHEYDTFLQMKDDTLKTPYGGSVPFSKLERDPAMKTI